jgi:hypothetical protein
VKHFSAILMSGTLLKEIDHVGKMLTTEWIRSEILPCSGLHTTTPSKMVLLLERGVSYTKYNIFVYVSFLGRSNNFVPHIKRTFCPVRGI